MAKATCRPSGATARSLMSKRDSASKPNDSKAAVRRRAVISVSAAPGEARSRFHSVAE